MDEVVNGCYSLNAAELEAYSLVGNRSRVRISGLGYDYHVKKVRESADYIIELADRIKAERQSNNTPKE